MKKTNIPFNSIRSYKHEIYSIECNKIGLSNYENKRYWVNNELSYPHGHWRIQSTSNNSCLL